MVTSQIETNERNVGQQRRRQVPRSSHAAWKPTNKDRDALEILKRAEVDRIGHLIELKRERMAASPFGYLRGAVPVMAYDLGQREHTGLMCQLCGDAHVRNLGAFAGIDGSLTFDINDFDETLHGPFEWDVKRMATSIYLAAREAGESEPDCRDAVRSFLHRYQKCVAAFAAMSILEIARYQVHRPTDLEAVAAVFAEAERSTPLHLRKTLTERAAAEKAKHPPQKAEPSQSRGDHRLDARPARVFRSDPPLLERVPDTLAGKVLDALERYKETIQPERRHLLGRYRALDVAFKVVGTGSVGLRDYCVYFEGNGPKDPLFLQMKQEVASAWVPYLQRSTTQKPRSEGARVVNGQRAMQVQSDPFLGHTQMEGRDYLVRQLNDHKGGVNLGTLDPEALARYADLCGELLARGHARSGDPASLAGYLGRGPQFEKAIASFAEGYADQTELDWEQLRKVRKAAGASK